MAGISSEAAKGIAYPTNKYKYNGIEETKELGLSEYDAKLRILDPQIAVWWQVDPETENMEMWSPYASNYDNPILYQDPLGNEPECCWEQFKDAVVQSVQQVSSLVAGAVNAWGSDQALGAGSKTASQAGIRGDNAAFYTAGQTVGHVVALVTGAAEVIGGGSGELASVGLATPIAIPVAVHGVSVFATAGYKLFSAAPIQEAPLAGGKSGTSREARREVMRKENIPTSQQPTSQKNTPAGRTYKYKVPTPGGGKTTKEVQQQLKDRNHPPHWEAGTPKKGGQKDPVGRNRLQNGKSKQDY